MPKAVKHVVTRPGRTLEEPPVEIPVAEDLATVPGIPLREEDVAFYSREEPLEDQSVEKSADREWLWTVYPDEVAAYIKGHDERVEPLVQEALVSGDIEPEHVPDPNRDITDEVRAKARQLGFGEVGFTRFDRKYVFARKKRWAKYEHAICLAYEQDYESTQSSPSLDAEHAHFGTYEVMDKLAQQLAGHIRSLGYHAQIHSPNDGSAVYIPMFVAAGLGQLGANGQLLSPHFGSRGRLMLITTDAPVKYDEPVDYGIHSFCQTCQVCVNRCPGRALVKEKVWWRGAEKNKAIYDRCRPVTAHYEGCAVCIKVCPIQRYGMKPVMEHYVDTGQVLGKGTHNLEGFALRDKGYFGPGELPHFDTQFFQFPRGTSENWLFEKFKKRLKRDGIPPSEDLTEFAQSVKQVMDSDQSFKGSE